MNLKTAVSNSTVLQTQTALIHGKRKTVQTLLRPDVKQGILYKVNGVLFGSKSFWALNPRFVKA